LSIIEAISFTVGLSMTSLMFRLLPNFFLNLFTKIVAKSECPPISKKLSFLPILLMPKRLAQISDIDFSVLERGFSYSLFRLCGLEYIGTAFD